MKIFAKIMIFFITWLILISIVTFIDKKYDNISDKSLLMFVLLYCIPFFIMGIVIDKLFEKLN